ncbi:hypothetical protein HYQ44_017447 [Verticillium longisporum]|nr:hypothetical protein HYQ44_017447 [Verticillium longisporum]
MAAVYLPKLSSSATTNSAIRFTSTLRTIPSLCSTRTTVIPQSLIPLQPIPPRARRNITTTSFTAFHATSRTMGSDEDYMAFLDKANEDPSAGRAKPTSAPGGGAQLKAQDNGVEVPEAIAAQLKGGDKIYVSEADEPFEGVALSWSKRLPDEVQFAELVEHPEPKEAEVEILDPFDWDSEGIYKELIEAVREASKGNDVRVYKISRGGARFEYWVLTALGEGKAGRLVGAKALSVES